MAYKRSQGQKVKTLRQVRFLMSSASPLTPSQKKRLRRELRTGAVRIVRRK